MTAPKAKRIQPPAPDLDASADYADALKSVSARTIRALPNRHSVTGWVPSPVRADVSCYGPTGMCCGSGSAPSPPPTT